ncbi:MAG: 2-C-methyl-D-erythritol 4-phosphate cytidylyltransferase [Spirochaetales bacterium]|jgi:2-C-methyl-D-erythritol 4-phosphate cytidylyltransferase/2-C-methyl-D-erythritol 4-phosphate cytidylyltransferase/2-C-methyl-D-erythritol 2,4-cyclodiphosphate synthase|nr:2-C-methyl-D-erythritol 4-phosphate cytidylyltransferase [Spirochaetales bacterium]
MKESLDDNSPAFSGGGPIFEAEPDFPRPQAVGGHSVLITAAGTSFRFGASLKKEFFPLLGETVLHHTFMAFYSAGIFDYFCVTFLKDHEEQTRTALGRRIVEGLGSRLILVQGGATRQESVCRGLEALSSFRPPTVLIHDGARPWVSQDLVLRVFKTMLDRGAAAPLIPTVDAIKRVDASGRIARHLDRPATGAVQTPQGFQFSAILEAHRKARTDGSVYIDDTEIYHRYCGEVFTVPGEFSNIKITYPRDIIESPAAGRAQDFSPLERDAL